MGANASSPRRNRDGRQHEAKYADSKFVFNENLSSVTMTTLNSTSGSVGDVCQQKKPGKPGKHRGRRQQAMANAAAGILSSFRKSLLHQLIFRKSPSSSSSNAKAHQTSAIGDNSNIRANYLRQLLQSPREHQVITRASSRPNSNSKSVKSFTTSTAAPVAHFDDQLIENDNNSPGRCFNRQFEDSFNKQKAAAVNSSQLVQQNAIKQRINNNQAAPATSMTTHVRIRISCSDSLSDALRRCDASTQTEQGGHAESNKNNASKRQSVPSANNNNTSSRYQQSSTHHHSNHHNNNNNKENRQILDEEKLTKSVSSGISSGTSVCWLGSNNGSTSSSGVDVSTVDEGHRSACSSSIMSSSVSSATNSVTSITKKQEPPQQQEQTVLMPPQQPAQPSSSTPSCCESLASNKGVVTRRTTIQASTGELLECLGQFVRNRFSHIAGVTNTTVVSWMRAIDRSLISQGWQDTPFISPGTVVFVYMLLRDSSMPHPSSRLIHLNNITSNSNLPSSPPSANKLSSAQHQPHLYYKASDIMNFDASLKPTLFDLHCHVNACLYIAYSYAGIEISYPQRPFNIVEQPPPPTPPTSTTDFWQRTLDVTLALSDKMLRLNSDPLFFARTFAELKAQGVVTVATSTSATPALSTHRPHNNNRGSGPPNTPPDRTSPPIITAPITAELITPAPSSRHGVRSNSAAGGNNGCSFKAAQLANGVGHRNSTTIFGTSNNTCRASVITPGLMAARERAGEHYTSLLI